MISSLFSRTPPHQHAEPAQRILGIAELPPDAEELAQLLASDPVAEVRAAAAQRSTHLAALVASWDRETDPAVRAALVTALGRVLAATTEEGAASVFIASDACADAIRAEVARQAQDGARRAAALAAIRDDAVRMDLALHAGRAETRLAAAEQVRTADALHQLAEAAKNKDHGVARLARQRLDAIRHHERQEADADAIVLQLEALADEPGPILSAVIELNRRWTALGVAEGSERTVRCEAARLAIQARFEREQNEQRGKVQFERKWKDWMVALSAATPADADALAALRTDLVALRLEAQERGDEAALTRLEQAEQRIALWEEELKGHADALGLVLEAERLAAGTSIDHAELPVRWQALSRAIRSADLTRRFEAALTTVEHRRLAQIQAAQQEANAAKQQVHALLHTGEVALAAGQIAAAREAADQIRALKPAAGQLPKPTTQRLSRLVQQVVDLERWESFGQQNARTQLCERAEALGAQPPDAPKLALEVQKLRNEWKTLDAQYAGVPKALWERFNGACERAYAPAARHFAEVAAKRKEARKRREDFIAAAAGHAATLPGDAPDWRAVEHWLRDIDRGWREGDLGSVDPGAWKKLDLRFKDALAPLRDALSAAREQAKAARQKLIDEVVALQAKAIDRDVPSQVKSIQAKWQAQAKTMSLAQRDERALWTQFRAACDAVFDARQSKRKEEDGRKTEARQALQDLCVKAEQLAQSADRDDQEVRRILREVQEQWKQRLAAAESGQRDLEARFSKAKAGVDALLAARARSREAAVWQTLAGKERLCEELDDLVRQRSGGDSAAAQIAAVQERWAGLPAMSAAWEKKMQARRDAAIVALTDESAAGKYFARIEQGMEARREGLMELELMLGMDSPAELREQRLALQVKKLKERFSSAANAGAATAAERLLAWCAQPGVADALDRGRAERIFVRLEQTR